MKDGLPASVQTVRAGLGPYERWMFGPGKTYDLAGLLLDDEVSLSCLAEFPGGLPEPEAAFALPLRIGDGPTMLARLPTIYRSNGFAPAFLPVLLTPAEAGHARSCLHAAAAELHLDTAHELAAATQIRLNFPVRAETIDPGFRPGKVATAGLNPPPRAEPLVILAIIDHGIPFAHRGFRHGPDTRIDYCWSQSAPHAASGDVLFGREFSGREIDRMMAFHDGDEDAVYRAAGLLTAPGRPPMPLDRMHAHGAHVLGSMAGGWPADTAARARIIAVDLPSTSTWETSGFGTDMFMLAAMHYIFDRAARIAAAHGQADAPLVINLSYGYSGGPHDRSGLLERAFDELIAARRKLAPTALVMPSGNGFQDRLTARIGPQHFTAGPGGAPAAALLHWFAPPNDMTSSFLEFWFPPGMTDRDLHVDVLPPGATDPANADLLPAPEQTGATCNLVFRGRIVGHYTVERYHADQWRAVVALAPSDPKALLDPPQAPAPAGLWTFRFRQGGATAIWPKGGVVACRVQCDTSYGQGNTGARQSCFVDPAYAAFGANGAEAVGDSGEGRAQVFRFGSLNGMAASRSALVVAGYDPSTGRAVSYSGAGPLPGTGGSDGQEKVHLAAPAARTSWTQGIVSYGTRTGIFIAQQGTSSAAPQVARDLAQAFLATAPRAGDGEDNYLSYLARTRALSPVPDAKDRTRLGHWKLQGVPLRD